MAVVCVCALASAAYFVVAFIGGAETIEAIQVISVVMLLAIATVLIIFGRSGSVHRHRRS